MSKENYSKVFTVELCRETSKLPTKATKESTGYDLHADIQEPVTITPLQRVFIPLGVKIQGKSGIDIEVRGRSGMAKNHGVTILNSPGTVDPDYTGEIHGILVNLSTDVYTVNPGERVAQLVINERGAVLKEGKVSDNEERGNSGFGSSGKY